MRATESPVATSNVARIEYGAPAMPNVLEDPVEVDTPMSPMG